MMQASLDELLRALSGPGMMEHMNVFARWTKHSGTPEELESLRYVEARMREYGFHTDLILHDAYISIPGKAQVDVAGQEFGCTTH